MSLSSGAQIAGKVIELTVFVLYFLTVLNANGQGRRWLATLFSGTAVGLIAELAISNAPHPAYYYGPKHFWVNVHNVPVCIGLGWGLVFYASTWTAQRLASRSAARSKKSFTRSLFASSFVAGALGVNLDLSLDPLAQAYKLWTWQTWVGNQHTDNAPDQASTMFGVPYNNFVAWVLGVFVYGFVVRLAFHLVDRGSREGNLVPGLSSLSGKSSKFWDSAIPVLAGVCAVIVLFLVRLIADAVYQWTGEARVFGFVFLLGLCLLWVAVPRGSRTEEVNWVVLAIAAFFHLSSFALLLGLMNSQKFDQLTPLLVLIPMNFVGGMLAFAWPSLEALLAFRQAPDQDLSLPLLIRKTLSTYGGRKMRVLVSEPRTAPELLGLLAFAKASGRSATFRTGGQAFDTQSLNDQLVISLRRFTDIRLDAAAHEVTVGCGATWGKILGTTLRAGLAPYLMVTNSVATAGGTLSAHSLGRFSPSVGREGEYIKGFKLLTPDGLIRECVNAPGSPTIDYCRAVIAGLGYVGAVLEITYKLQKVPGADCVVETTFTLVDGIEKTASRLLPGARYKPLVEPFVKRISQHCGTHVATAPPIAMSAAVNLRGGAWGLLAESRYAPAEKLKPSIFHSPNSIPHLLLQFCATIPGLRAVGYWLAYKTYAGAPKNFVDAPQGYTFFEDGNRRVRRFLQNLGVPARLVQQTFMIPCDVGDPGAATDALNNFLRAADLEFDGKKIDPALVDVLYVGKDVLDFYLSSSRNLSAFAVTFTFERLFGELDKEEEAMRVLSDVCFAHQGRVHLVKHVHAKTSTLATMYAAPMALVKTVRNANNSGVLANEFSKRALPEI